MDSWVTLPTWLVTVVDWWIVAVPHPAWFVCFYLLCLKCECLIEVWWKYCRKVIIFLLGVDCDYGKSVLHLLFLLLSPDVRRLKVNKLLYLLLLVRYFGIKTCNFLKVNNNNNNLYFFTTDSLQQSWGCRDQWTEKTFKGSLTRDFSLKAFFMNQFPLRPLSIPLPFRIFTKIHGDMRK